MDLFEFLKESVPKRDNLKQLIVAHTGLSPPAFVAAVTAGAATIAAISCYLNSTCCASTDRGIETEANDTKDTSSKEIQTSCCNCECNATKEAVNNCECNATKEAVNNEAKGDVSILTIDEEVQAQELIADIMASDYMQVDADEMATPVETPKEF